MAFIFTSALVLGFSGAMMPGSLLTYTIRQALANGPRAGFVIIFGHAVLELALLFLIFLGFDIVLQSREAQIGIGIVGGILLVYMGIDMIRNSLANKVKIEMDSGGSDSKGLFVSGIVISAANPYFLLWWAIIGLGFVMRSHQMLGYFGVALFFFGHILADFIWYGLVSTVVGKTRKFIKEGPYRFLIVVLGAMLVFFGGRFLWDAVTTLIS
ncbi:MAG: lysine transporter LysE [Firmicutes bacterium HGW-Firmicutes-11]|jgi:threonine/homoserine/homoserine lactone efflux protein|nr:MAG: lysine transporter LysE [Firmicutes bacterium HGW-Firmicutes-11]